MPHIFAQEVMNLGDILYVTLVGYSVEEVFKIVSSSPPVNSVNKVNMGNLGNFKTINYEIDIPEEKVFAVRKTLMCELSKNPTIMPMYCHGDNMSVYIFKRFDKTSREKQGI